MILEEGMGEGMWSDGSSYVTAAAITSLNSGTGEREGTAIMFITERDLQITDN